MNSILVSGLINIETTAQADRFPIEYQPIDYKFFGVKSAPSGVGLNIAFASYKIGDKNASSGFLSESELIELFPKCKPITE